MLALLERQSVRLKPYRWRFAAISAASIGGMFAAISWLRAPFFWVVHVATPVLMWAWGLLCLNTWFSTDPNRSFMGLIPRRVVTFVAHAAIDGQPRRPRLVVAVQQLALWCKLARHLSRKPRWTYGRPTVHTPAVVGTHGLCLNVREEMRLTGHRTLAYPSGLLVLLATCLLLMFPGSQTPLALTLATGIGTAGVQSRVDAIEDKVIRGAALSLQDKAFLRDLYSCFAKGGRLTIVLRQSAEMMERYLSRSGQQLRTAPRIFLNSRPVVAQVRKLRSEVLSQLGARPGAEEKRKSPTFYMGDPNFFDAFVGLYFGHVAVHARRLNDGSTSLRYTAYMPWKWPSYGEMLDRYGEYHAQTFPIPNAKSILFGDEYCLMMDDGLGGALEELGLAKAFLVTAEWDQVVP